MAGLALRSVFSVMFIILFMARVAIFWGTFIDVIGMATLTGNLTVLPFQFEGGKVVIEVRILP